MNYIIRKPWHLPQRLHTAEEVYRNRKLKRREFLASVGLSATALGSGVLLSGCNQGTDEEVRKAGQYDLVADAARKEGEEAVAEGRTSSRTGPYRAPRNETYDYGRPETGEVFAARYTNFYEFSGQKHVWRFVGDFKPSPWKIEVAGLCSKPQTFDMDDLYRLMSFEERHYRHRCVETWAMCVPWAGFPLRELLKRVKPQPAAKFVAFESFDRPEEAPNVNLSVHFPWPYTEVLTMDEAQNELAFIATGMYGHTLLKQHGAPIRLVVPWKYGFKSIKSIVKITLNSEQTPTFWNTASPDEYDIEANVNPHVPHLRWSQQTEWMLGTHAKFDTVIYNGYGEFVGKLYSS